MELRRDRIASDGNVVGIYIEGHPEKAIYECEPDKADRIIEFMDRIDNPEDFICPNEDCGKLMLELMYDEGGRKELCLECGDWREQGSTGDMYWYCPHCETELEYEEVEALGVL